MELLCRKVLVPGETVVPKIGVGETLGDVAVHGGAELVNGHSELLGDNPTHSSGANFIVAKGYSRAQIKTGMVIAPVVVARRFDKPHPQQQPAQSGGADVSIAWHQSPAGSITRKDTLCNRCGMPSAASSRRRSAISAAAVSTSARLFPSSQGSVMMSTIALVISANASSSVSPWPDMPRDVGAPGGVAYRPVGKAVFPNHNIEGVHIQASLECRLRGSQLDQNSGLVKRSGMSPFMAARNSATVIRSSRVIILPMKSASISSLPKETNVRKRSP